MSLSKILVFLMAPVLLGGGPVRLLGERADGTTVSIPREGASRTLIGIAAGRKAGPSSEEWLGPVYLRFVAKHGLFAAAIDADVFFVPLFVGADKAAYEPTLRKFRKGAEPAIVDHVVFCKAEEGTLAALGIVDRDEPCFLVLDAAGNVTYTVSGPFSEEKLDALESALLE